VKAIQTTKRPVSPFLGLASILAALLYGASPIDLIPDLLVLIGWVDDAAIGGILLIFGIRILAKYYRAKRTQRPLPVQ